LKGQGDRRQAVVGLTSLIHRRMLPSQRYKGQMNLITEAAGEGGALGSAKNLA
jgi:hypothetical protein